MATITLTYDARNSIAAKTIRYVLSLGLFNKEEPRTAYSFDKSIKELESGKTHRLENTKNPLAEILQ